MATSTDVNMLAGEAIGTTGCCGSIGVTFRCRGAVEVPIGQLSS